MRCLRRCILAIFLLLASTPVAWGQGWGEVRGTITEAPSGEALPGVTVLVDGTNYGTASQSDGRYELRLPTGDYRLRFSAIGFQTRYDSVSVRRDEIVELDVVLEASVEELEGIVVEAPTLPTEAGVHHIDPATVRDIPTPLREGLDILTVMPGVAANNELSYQYSVRGGGFNENLLFINGFEVFMPFRPRQGEQEGLSLLNPDLASDITFYTGGFPARYGGKLSSALDVRYYRPENEPINGNAYLSTLDAGATLGASAMDGRLGWIAGVRKATPGRFFGTQELKGSYQPDYTDVQGFVSYRLKDGHELEAIGMLASHEFRFYPSGSRTYFGILSLDPSRPSDLQALWRTYDDDSEELDRYQTRFGGVRLANRISSRLTVEHDVSYFGTEEREFFDLRATSLLYDVDPTQPPESDEGRVLTGENRQEERADNRVVVNTLTGQGRYRYALERHALEAGWSVRQLFFEDRLSERSTVEGVIDHNGTIGRIVVNELADEASLETTQAAVYAQNTMDVLPRERNRLTATVGLRADYFSFNDEWTVSPRLSTRFQASQALVLIGSLGIYYQAPTYRELRGKPEPGETILGALNHDIRSQSSVQYVFGGEYFMEQRRLYLRAEAYYKALSNLISYDVDNVRVQYSSENDAEGHAYGLDLQLRGEFVPGLESWVNYSYLVANERFLPPFRTERNNGMIPRPTDQRHTFSFFMQDYVPTDDSYRLHLRILFGSGLPYTPPVAGERTVGNTVTQKPGPRNSARFIEYRRVDMGVTREIALADDLLGRDVMLRLTAEVLNLFDMTNTVSYSWFPDEEGNWNRVPTRLTPRTLNVRLTVDF